MLSRTWTCLCIVLLAAGCGPRDVRPRAADVTQIAGLELVGQYSMPALKDDDPLKKARLGGVSGLAVDRTNGQIFGISDDSQENRFFVFSIAAPAIPLRVDLRAYVPLPFGPGAPSPLDAEGIALTRSGHLFVSSEGLSDREPRVPPAIVEFTRRPEYVGALAIPAKFLQPATGPLDRGVRRNEGFEPLTLTPDDRRLFTASETSLAQDGERPSFARGTMARMLEFVDDNGTFVARREFAYPLDPVPPVPFKAGGYMVNGLVELLALSDTDFISMDRGYAEEGGENGRRATFVRIFQTSIAGATDISSFDSIRGRSGITVARKRLLVDFSKLDGLDPVLQAASLDNFEGLALGPTLADGSATLLVVSDDNFSPRQRTWFLLFRIVK